MQQTDCTSLFWTCIQAGSPWKIQIISESVFCLWKETNIRSGLKIIEKFYSNQNEILHLKNSTFWKKTKVERISLLKWCLDALCSGSSVSQAPNQTAREKRIVLQNPVPWYIVGGSIPCRTATWYPQWDLKYRINSWTFRPLSDGNSRWKFIKSQHHTATDSSSSHVTTKLLLFTAYYLITSIHSSYIYKHAIRWFVKVLP